MADQHTHKPMAASKAEDSGGKRVAIPQRVRRFITLCCIATVCVSLLTWFGLGSMLKGEVLDGARRDAIYLASALRDLEVDKVIHRQSEGTYSLMISPSEIDQFEKRMRIVMSQFGVVKVKLFDTQQRVIYSTDLRIIGQTSPAHRGLSEALAGHITSDFARPETAWDMPGEATFNVDVVETFMPIAAPNDNIVGCLAIYLDVARDMQAVKSMRLKATSLIAGLLVLVFSVLSLIMHRANQIITDQQDAIEASEQRIRAIVDHVAEGIVVYDGSSIVHSLNSAAIDMFALKNKTANGLKLTDLIAPLQGSGVGQDGLPGLFDSEDGRGVISQENESHGFEVRGVKHDRSTFPAWIVSRRVRLPGEIVYAAVIRDLTEQKRNEMITRENDLRRTKEMSTIAQLATGVAHEIRNPLTSMMLLVQKHREDAEAQTDLAVDMGVVEEEIRRMTRSLGTFLEFARPGKSHQRDIDSDELLDKACRLIEARAGKQRVRILRQPGTGQAVSVRADPDQIQQVLLNLMLNALDVMPHGGTLGLASALTGDGFLELKITDTGPGLLPEVADSLFEPFTSTKDTGMGLGLVVSKRIMEDHRGGLIGFNLPESGACFVAKIPLADQFLTT